MDDLCTLHRSPVFLRREALAAGYRDADLRQGVLDKVITRIRHGAYVERPTWTEASAEERHLLHADAVILSHNAPLALSHISASVAHGFRNYRADLSRIHVLCLGETVGRTHSDVVYHQASPKTVADMSSCAGRLVVPPARAALEAASCVGVRDGLVILDSALDQGSASHEELSEEYRRIEGSPGSQALRITVSLARSGSESVGETLGRYLMWRHHIPEPVLQLEVRDDDGTLIARLDWAWPRLGLCGEFDGREKYTRYLRDGESVADAVMREKAREDHVREVTDLRMFRMVWSDLESANQARTAARIQRAFRFPQVVAS